MTEDRKKEVAVFRFGVVSDFVNGRSMSRKERKRLIRQKCALKWDIPYSEKTRIGESTLRRWIRTYKKSGGDIDSLMPSDRSGKGKSRSLDDETSSAPANLRLSVAGLTVPQIVERMNAGGLVTPGTNPHPSTVYRFLHANDLMEPSEAASIDRVCGQRRGLSFDQVGVRSRLAWYRPDPCPAIPASRKGKDRKMVQDSAKPTSDILAMRSNWAPRR